MPVTHLVERFIDVFELVYSTAISEAVAVDLDRDATIAVERPVELREEKVYRALAGLAVRVPGEVVLVSLGEQALQLGELGPEIGGVQLGKAGHIGSEPFVRYGNQQEPR